MHNIKSEYYLLFSELSTAQINELILDVKSMQNGSKFFYAVDTHEIFDFCFPISSSDMYLNTQMIEKIKNDQVALYELFALNNEIPIFLINEYKREFHFLSKFLEINHKELFGKIEGIAKMADEIEEKSYIKYFIKDRIFEDSFEEALYKGIDSELALHISSFSYGYEKFLELEKKLKSIEELGFNYLTTIENEYIPSTNIETFTRILTGKEKINKWQNNKRLRNIRADIRAIEKIILFNKKSQDLTHKGKIDNPHIFLYISSAKRSKLLINLFKRQLPIINGTQLNFLRTREQILVYSLCKLYNSKSDINYNQTIERLEDFKKIVKEFESVDESEVLRKDQILVGNSEYFENLRFAKELNKYENLISFQVNMKNENVINYYKNFKDRFSRTEELLPYVSNKFNNSLSIIEAKYQTRKIGRTIQQYDPSFNPEYLINRLPLINELEDPRYEYFYQSLQNYFNAYKLFGKNKEELLEILDQFELIDFEITVYNWEHEILRCIILFFTLEPKAITFLESYLERLMEQSKETSYYSDFSYLLVRAKWLNSPTNNTVYFGKTMMKEFKDDPRFHHIIGYMSSKLYEHDSELCPQNLKQNITNFKKAITLTKADSSFEIITYLCLNNLVFSHCYDKNCDTYNLKKSREYLFDLKLLLPKSNWFPRFIQFHHTEALLEFREFQEFNSRGQKEDALNKIKQAYREINMIYFKVPYINYFKELYKEIHNAYKKLVKTK